MYSSLVFSIATEFHNQLQNILSTPKETPCMFAIIPPLSAVISCPPSTFGNLTDLEGLLNVVGIFVMIVFHNVLFYFLCALPPLPPPPCFCLFALVSEFCHCRCSPWCLSQVLSCSPCWPGAGVLLLQSPTATKPRGHAFQDSFMLQCVLMVLHSVYD